MVQQVSQSVHVATAAASVSITHLSVVTGAALLKATVYLVTQPLQLYHCVRAQDVWPDAERLT
jgi:hypothetical protein